MIQRLAAGKLPAKHHQALFTAEGSLAYEQCHTRDGFDGPYTISYHLNRPQSLQAVGDPIPLCSRDSPSEKGATSGAEPRPRSLAKRHFRTAQLTGANSTEPAPPFARRQRLLYNKDIDVAVIVPGSDDQSYSINQHDELLYVLSGSGTVRCPLGDLNFQSGDYVLLPKGIAYRLLFELPSNEKSSKVHILSLSFARGVGIPNRFRTVSGQLRLDAPYCHRDFRTPLFKGPQEENIREIWVRSGSSMQAFRTKHSPLDAIGWDGSVYPWAFPILQFQPRVSSYHLPPTWHGTFGGPGCVVCSFVPRPLDFGQDAIPCPYTHTSVDMDEVLFYAGGNFSSRRGVELGSLTLHPAPIAHGPHPGRYEQSLGAKETNELAVMLDCTSQLLVAPEALAIEDAGYDRSF